MQTTWDGLPIAEDHPIGSTVVVRRQRAETEFLVLHRAAKGPAHEGDWAWTSPAGCRLPGEPVYPAALRELHEEVGITNADVWAVDLVDVEHDRFQWLTAREARTRVLPSHVAETQVVRVGAIPRVRLGFRPMTGAAEEHYRPRLGGRDPTRMWVLEVNGRSVGMLQDYLVGDPSWVGKGIGTRMLWTFLRDVVRPHYPDAPTYFAAPDHRNAASLRVLAKLGFERGSLDVRRVLG